MLWNPKWFPGTNLQDINLDWILKKVSALRGGSTGQYLYKKSDKDFDFGWKTGGGGGGGTSDYLDLDNKPSINNVELIGNKTAADLGLAASSDIPEIPVQSVNGKTGVVVLSASDVGAYVKPVTGIPKTDLSSAVQESLVKADSAYSKPESGIPKTDLSSAVQTSLDKADSALQAVPSAYRTATAQDTIDAAQDAKIETIAGSLAMIESSPATTAHVIGEYIVYNGQLYKVTTAIAAGQTLTVGTNIEQTTMSNEIPVYSEKIGYGSEGAVTYASDVEWAMRRTALISYGKMHMLFIGFTPTAHPNAWYAFGRLNDVSIAPAVEGQTEPYEIRAPAVGENNTVRTVTLTETGEMRIYNAEQTGYYITFVWAK